MIKKVFTPGPWSVGSSTGHNVTQIHAAKDTICEVYGLPLHTMVGDVDLKFGEGLANARLIAASPDLLVALKELADCSPCQNGCAPDDMTCASNKARAAIAKAEGRS